MRDIDILFDLVKIINNSAPTIDELISNGFDNESAISLRNDFILSDKQKKEVSKSNNLIDFFFNNYNTKRFSCFNFSFRKPEDYKDYKLIGSYEADELIILKESSEIAILDCYDHKIKWIIAQDFEMFLKLLAILSQYMKLGYIGTKYTNEVKKEFKDRIINLLNNKKYYDFFIGIMK